MTDASIRTVAVTVRGRVQGVGYRAWTVRRARALGLSGHVRNLADGSVEATFSGPGAAVAAMLDACREGPSAARVDEVAVTDREDRPPAGFETLRG